MAEKVALACDHVGIELKAHVIAVLEEMGLDYQDFGTYSRESADYAIYAGKAARAVSDGQCSRGILLCGTGVGISIAANKIPGIRCVVCSEPYSAAMSRSHNNANMLALGARVVGSELARMILRLWLTTEFEGGRHARRVDQIMALERGEGLD